MEKLPRTLCAVLIAGALCPATARAQASTQADAALGVWWRIQSQGEAITEVAVTGEALRGNLGLSGELDVIAEGAYVGSVLGRVHFPMADRSRREPFLGAGVAWPLYAQTVILTLQAGEIYWTRSHPHRGFLIELHDFVFPPSDAAGNFVTVRVGMAFR